MIPSPTDTLSVSQGMCFTLYKLLSDFCSHSKSMRCLVPSMPFQIKQPRHIENGATCHSQSGSGSHEGRKFLLGRYILNISLPINQIHPENLDYIENVLILVIILFCMAFPFKVTGISCDIGYPGCGVGNLQTCSWKSWCHLRVKSGF